MATPTSRLLVLLELLQAQPLITGREIGERLDIGPRTVRRYIAALEELGIPVEGQRGVGGGYRIRPGYRLPPLMLSDDEAVVVSLGLLAARRLGLDSETAARRGRARRRSTASSPPRCAGRSRRSRRRSASRRPRWPARRCRATRCCELADAIRRRRRVRLTYRSHEGERSERRLSPYGLVVHSGRWYLAAYDHGRDDLRTFRVDRISRVRARRRRAPRPPAGFDAVAYVSARWRACRGRGRSRCCSRSRSSKRPVAPPADARRARGGRRRNAAADARELARLDGAAARRARLRLHDPCRPDELRTSVRRAAGRLLRG